MSKYKIQPCKNLTGEVSISGSKNSSLPILSAALLNNKETRLKNIPNLSDIENMYKLMRYCGAEIKKSDDNQVIINSRSIVSKKLPLETVNKLRGSFLLIAPILSRCGIIRIPYPGGCAIGARPIDLHLKGFVKMGASVKQCHGYVELTCDKLQPADIYLDFPSVGATENIMIAASNIVGETTIENAATEPEIEDLANFLTKMGAEINGAGTDTIKIVGSKTLKSASHTVIPDRIEAGTFLTFAAITKSNIKIKNVIPEHLKPITAKLCEMGFILNECDGSLEIFPGEKIKKADIKTLPHPGFPTDMQAQFMSLLSVIDGTSVLIETVFENRFMQVPELLRMGAKIKVDGRTAIIDGTKKLSGTKVKATDLRAGAALVAASLVASGETEIENSALIERGYENFEEKLLSLGVKIKKYE